MAQFLEFLSSNELTIVVCLMIIIFVLIMAIIIIDIVAKKGNSSETLNEAVDDETLENTNIKIDSNGLGMIADEEAIKGIDIDAVTKNLEKTSEIEEIKYVEDDEELEKTKALLELETLKRELAKMESEKVEVPINEQEITNKAEAEVNEEIAPIEQVPAPVIIEEKEEVNRPTIEEEVNAFESEQEENAIISVEELTKASQNISLEEIEKYEDDGNEPISLKELEAMYKSIEEPKEETVKEEEKITLPDFDIKVKPAVPVYEDKEFKNTPVISPVYGLKPTESSIMLEQTANLDKLNEEIRKTNEFLSALKELRKNLE